MILIRLKRQSFNDKLTYSIVVCSNKSSPASENFIEKIGHYKPIFDKWSNKYIFVDLDRLFFWLNKGAKLNKGLYVLIRPLIIQWFKSINF